MQYPSVMIVDDLPVFRHAIREAVERYGAHVVTEAENGRKALYRYAEYSPDLVFLDITMPVMDGIETLRWLKRFDPAVKVVMCSSVKDSDMIFEAIRLGAMDFVPKPFTEDRIAAAIYHAVGGQEGV